MKAKKTNSAKLKAGILNPASGKVLDLVIQKNGVIRAGRIYVKNKRKRVL
jgi:hypothetical protein